MPSASVRSVPGDGEDRPQRTVSVRQRPQAQAVLSPRGGAAGEAGSRRRPGRTVHLRLVGRAVRRRASAGFRGVPSRESPHRRARLRAPYQLVHLRPRFARGRNAGRALPRPPRSRSGRALSGRADRRRPARPPSGEGSCSGPFAAARGRPHRCRDPHRQSDRLARGGAVGCGALPRDGGRSGRHAVGAGARLRARRGTRTSRRARAARRGAGSCSASCRRAGWSS